ncbi:MAG: DUF4443 domain-containing protein [Candidatus Hodarchaeota archaeon]
MSSEPSIRATLNKFIENKAPGPKSNIYVFHLEQALRLIAKGDIDRKNKPIGRQKLANSLGLGAGSIRSLLKLLKKENLIETSKSGNEISKKGENYLKKLRKIIPNAEIEVDSARILTNSEKNFALLIKNYSEKIDTGMAQRDAAMKIGATGAITIIFKDRKYSIPQIEKFDDLQMEYPNFIKELEGKLQIEENDIIIIGTADDSTKAKAGVWAAAYSLIQ